MRATAGEAGTKSCDIVQSTPTHGCASVGRSARTYLHQHCVDTGCSSETYQEQWIKGVDTDGQRERERESGKSILAARHDNDDEKKIYIYKERERERALNKCVCCYGYD